MSIEFSQRFRRQVAPYNVVQSLAVLAGPNYCPALQTIGAGALPDVDRASCPTVVQAVVSATAADNSGSVGAVTDTAVTNIVWMVQRGDEAQGSNIQAHAAWTGLFAIGTDSDKGRLTIRKNIPAGETWKIWMECVISDQRRGTTLPIPVTTDSVMLYSIADADDKYTMSTDRPACELYEQARDRRLVHDYMVWRGEAHTLTDDGNTYLRPVTATLRQGGTALPASAYTVKVYSISGLSTRTEATPATDLCVSSIAGQTVTFDLRFATERTYQIACLVDGVEVAYKTYGWVWSTEAPTTDEGIVGAATCSDNIRVVYRPKLNLGSSLLRYPEVGFVIKWHWRNLTNNSLFYVGTGESMEFDLTTSGLFTADEAEVGVSVDRRGAFTPISDGTAVYTDENGNVLIEN